MVSASRERRILFLNGAAFILATSARTVAGMGLLCRVADSCADMFWLFGYSPLPSSLAQNIQNTGDKSGPGGGDELKSLFSQILVAKYSLHVV